MSASLVPPVHRYSAHRYPVHRIAPIWVAITLAFVATPAIGDDRPSAIGAQSVDRLKALYLGCEQAASSGSLTGGGVMSCSMVYETLKEKAFEGEFRQIRSWLDRHSRPMG